jgi:hypothetical protein
MTVTAPPGQGQTDRVDTRERAARYGVNQMSKSAQATHRQLNKLPIALRWTRVRIR